VEELDRPATPARLDTDILDQFKTKITCAAVLRIEAKTRKTRDAGDAGDAGVGLTSFR